MDGRIDLADGGWVIYEPNFSDTVEAGRWMTRLSAELPWRQPNTRFGPTPRLTAWFSDPDVKYAYSGIVHEPEPWPDLVMSIKRLMEAFVGTAWNSVLVNYYRDGRDSMGLHADDEPELGTDPIIGSLSLGDQRRFVAKHRRTGEKREWSLGGGSLLVMGGTLQSHWVHGVPKTARSVGPRINMTFRRILPTRVVGPSIPRKKSH